MNITKEIYKEISEILIKYEIPATTWFEEENIEGTYKKQQNKHIQINLVIPDFFEDTADKDCQQNEQICVKDILPNHPIKEIMIRMIGPNNEDIFCGFCSWNGKNLISDDGDTYSLSEKVNKYQFNENKTELVYWVAND